MQILGKRSKMLLTALLAIILITLGTSFAVWDGQAALAATGDAASYANAKVGDVIQFGRYWQKAMPAGYDDKDPIEWIVVDKDERTGQLTLMSKYILAECSYFGTRYTNNANKTADAGTNTLLNDIRWNQSWAESTLRAFLNNLERYDLGGDKFDATKGLDNDNRIPSVAAEGKLKASVGFSNGIYYTGLKYSDATSKELLNDPNSGMIRVSQSSLIDYRRPKVTDWTQRLARNGFYDEAFTKEEKDMIMPKEIPGQHAYRWPAGNSAVEKIEYIPGTKDKVWVPSVEELNFSVGVDTDGKPMQPEVSPGEVTNSVPFEYFRNWEKYSGGATYSAHVGGSPTEFASYTDHRANASIPGWATDVIIDANVSKYPAASYWTRTASSRTHMNMMTIRPDGSYIFGGTNFAYGVRPCIILKY